MGEHVDNLLIKLRAAPGIDAREKMAKKGTALPDGSYPIPDVEFLKKAIQSFGRAPEEKRAAVKAHIKRRARALGREDLIPDSWG